MYEFNQLHHVGVVAKRQRTAAEMAAHEGDNNEPRGKKQVAVTKEKNMTMSNDLSVTGNEKDEN